jgi:hypothetical protein
MKLLLIQHAMIIHTNRSLNIQAIPLTCCRCIHKKSSIKTEVIGNILVVGTISILTDHSICQLVTVEVFNGIPACFDERRSNKLDQASNVCCLLIQYCWPHMQLHHPLKQVNIRVNIFLHVVLAEEELHCLLPIRPY